MYIMSTRRAKPRSDGPVRHRWPAADPRPEGSHTDADPAGKDQGSADQDRQHRHADDLIRVQPHVSAARAVSPKCAN